MDHLHQILAQHTKEWREASYPCEEYPAIVEILEHQVEPETKTLKFLRIPQLRALEIYWYLRLVEKTPHIFDLYTHYFPKTRERREVLGLTAEEKSPYCAK